MNRRLLAVLAAAVVVAACAAPGAATTVTVTAPAPSPSTADVPSMSDDEEFLMLLYSEPGFFGQSESLLTELGHSICEALDRGYTIEEIGEVALSSGLDSDEAAAIVAASVVAICPQHQF